MFVFGEKKQTDEELSCEYVGRILAGGHHISLSVAQAVQLSTQGVVIFPINDDVDLLVSLAILGTSFGVMNGYSQLMSAGRGVQIASFCRKAIEKDLGLSGESARKVHEILDSYQFAFEQSAARKSSPFAEIAEMILWHCLGPESVTSLLIPGTSSLNPFVHEIVSDALILNVTEALAFWKGK